MLRYQEFSEIITASQGKRRYASLYYPKMEPKASDIYMIANKMDRLDLLAYEYYGDARMWVIIAKANTLHAATLRIPPGLRIRIPYPLDYDQIQDQFNEKQF